MKSNDVDRLLAAFFEVEAPRREPEGLLPQVLATTSRRRPAPRWLATLRGSPMTTRTGTAGAMPGRALALVLLLLGALVAIGLGTLVVGGRPAIVSPSSVAPSVDPLAVQATFKRWQVSFRQPDNWTMFDETSTVDRGFDAFDSEGNVVGSAGFGTLAAAVHPNSSYVVGPLTDMDVGTTVEEYLTWLRAHPRLDVTEPVDVTVAGRPAHPGA